MFRNGLNIIRAPFAGCGATLPAMTFEELEIKINNLIAKDEVEAAITLLSAYFHGNEKWQAIVLQSGRFHSLKKDQANGVIDYLTVQQQLNQLRANILEFVASEKKARERDPGEELPEVDIRSLYLASLARVAVLLTLLQAEAEETGLTITQVQKRTKAGNRKYIVAALQEMEENGWVEKTKAGKSAYWRLSEEGMKLAVESERTFRSIFPKE